MTRQTDIARTRSRAVRPSEAIWYLIHFHLFTLQAAEKKMLEKLDRELKAANVSSRSNFISPNLLYVSRKLVYCGWMNGQWCWYFSAFPCLVAQLCTTSKHIISSCTTCSNGSATATSSQHFSIAISTMATVSSELFVLFFVKFSIVHLFALYGATCTHILVCVPYCSNLLVTLTLHVFVSYLIAYFMMIDLGLANASPFDI